MTTTPGTTGMTSMTSMSGADTSSGSGWGSTGFACDDTSDCETCFACAAVDGCAFEAQQCADDMECSALIECSNTCAEFSVSQKEYDLCFSDCAETLPGGVDLFFDYALCAENECSMCV